MKTILVIEDNVDNMDLVEQILVDADYKVIGAVTAEYGLDVIKSRVIDLILMDISLPEMDGLEATRRIRIDHGQMPIIALTAHAMITDKENAIEAGCSDYLSKPVDEESLLEMIETWLQQYE